MDPRVEEEINVQAISLLEPILADDGYMLVDITFRREPVGWVLRLYVDREGGITVDECARISRRIGDVVEAKNLIQQRYVLEVSSPGLDRRLKSDRDFRWAVGRRIRVSKKEPRPGEKELIGLLKQYDGTSLTIEENGEPTVVPVDRVASARVLVEI